MSINTFLLVALALITAKRVLSAIICLIGASCDVEWMENKVRNTVKTVYEEATKDPLSHFARTLIKDIPFLVLVSWAVWTLWGRV